MIPGIQPGFAALTAALTRFAGAGLRKLAERVLNRFSDFFVGPW